MASFFFTSYESRKAQEIAQNPQVSVTFLWKELERQVNIQGRVKKTSRAISEKYFSKRPRNSQLGAAASQQSAVIPSRKLLEDEYNRLDKLHEGHAIPCPDEWGGFIIKPSSYEFWQGRTNRLHDRFRYQLIDGQWIIDRLSHKIKRKGAKKYCLIFAPLRLIIFKEYFFRRGRQNTCEWHRYASIRDEMSLPNEIPVSRIQARLPEQTIFLPPRRNAGCEERE